MKTCSCGYMVDDDSKFCPECGKEVPANTAENNIPTIAPLGGVKPISAPLQPQPAQQKKEAKPTLKTDSESNAAPISAMFEKPDSPKATKQVVKPHESPKPSPNVEVKPVANATSSKKFDPMKNQPPLASQFATLRPGITILHIAILSIPIIGFIYALILMFSSQKYNTKTLAVAYVTLFLIVVTVAAAAFLILAKFFEPQFNSICRAIKYMIDTFMAVIQPK